MADSSAPLIVGIESSCDETGVGVVRGSSLLANVVSSSLEEHARFGGVVPENASRAHLEALTPSLEQALMQAKVRLAEVDAIAVTSGPGLAGALMVGISAAKALAFAANKPLYAVNHLVAHVGAGLIETPTHPAVKVDKNLAALLVSGGHTEILRVDDIACDVRRLGATLDDAAGEAYDKVARLLGLGYPGGAVIDALSTCGDRDAIAFPRALMQPGQMKTREEGGNRYDFSFSGLKTAVSRHLHQQRKSGGRVDVADVAASFQEAVVDVLSMKAVLACRDNGMTTLLVGGGVAANRRLRQVLRERTDQAGVELVIPETSLCTDNGAMVAALGARLVQSGARPSDLSFSARPNLPAAVICQS